MKFKLNGPIGEGREIDFDENKMLVKEARELQRVTGLGLRQFGEGMRDGNIDALMGMVYLGLRRDGVAIRWKDLDEFNIADLEVIDEEQADDAAVEGGTAGELTDPDADGLRTVVVGEVIGGDVNGDVPPRPTPQPDPLKDVPVPIP